MSLQFTDHEGIRVNYDATSPITWRISIYVVVIRGGKLLLMRPAYSDHHDLPGGMVEPNESLLDAAIRECWEETGYRFDAGQNQPIYIGEQWYFEDDDGSYHHSLFFAVRGAVDATADRDWKPFVGETEDVVWLPMTRMESVRIHRNHRLALAALL